MIVDTNAYSALADGHPELERIVGFRDLALPVVVLGEYWFGVRRSRRRREYERWIEESFSRFDLLEVSRTTAHVYAEIRQELSEAGGPIPTNDVWIAALAREHARLRPPSCLEQLVEFVRIVMMTIFIRPSLYWIPAALPWLGLGRTIASWVVIRWLYLAGVPPQRLSALYRTVR